jgi:dTDP-3-amino-3,4,6-trideoxy-alpha-D-glucose transaminase
MSNYGQSVRYVHDELGRNSRVDELHAAMLRAALLPRLGAWTERHRETLDGTALIPVPTTDTNGCVYYLFPIRVRTGARDAFREFLASGGISSGVHYRTLTFAQKAIDDANSSLETALAASIANEELPLPIHPLITDDEVSRVFERCREWEALHAS